MDADDHNIAIYYPSSAGGGCKKLFRKVGDRSSEFYPEINEVRRDGSYIYEEFIETQGTDVKMCKSEAWLNFWMKTDALTHDFLCDLLAL